MFAFNQIVVSRPQFLIESLDARRLLSASVEVDAGEEVAASDEIVVTLEAPALEEDSAVYTTLETEIDPMIYDAEILTLEEPIENLEDVPAEEDFIRYTLVPQDNWRGDFETTEELPSEDLVMICGFAELPGEEVVIFEEDPNVLVDPNPDMYTMVFPPPAEAAADGSFELPPPPPAQAAGLAAASSLSDDVLELSDGSVLA